MSMPNPKSRERAIAIVAVLFAGLSLIVLIAPVFAPSSSRHVVPDTPQPIPPPPPPPRW